MLAKTKPAEAIAAIDARLGERHADREAIGVGGAGRKNEAGDGDALVPALTRLLAKDYPPEQTLDLLEAAAKFIRR